MQYIKKKSQILHLPITSKYCSYFAHSYMCVRLSVLQSSVCQEDPLGRIYFLPNLFQTNREAEEPCVILVTRNSSGHDVCLAWLAVRTAWYTSFTLFPLTRISLFGGYKGFSLGIEGLETQQQRGRGIQNHSSNKVKQLRKNIKTGYLDYSITY